MDLLQDVPSIPLLKRIVSCEARACISLCRPEGRYVSKRKLKGRSAPIVPTQPFHAGEFSLRSLTEKEDLARGFVTGVVASSEHLKQTFQLKDNEAEALATVLPALRLCNPWHGAYCTSLRNLDAIKEFVLELQEEGCLAPRIPESITTSSGKTVTEEIGDERAVLLVPAEAYEAGGSYEKLRVAADTICRAQLQRPLPEAWQHLHRGELTKPDGSPMQIMPIELKQNASFTKVSWQDPHILPKLFTRQFPYGTGGYQSALHTVEDFKHYMLHAIHSLDGEFLDDKDGGEFLFFTYELSLKRKLYRDYVGKAMYNDKKNTEGQSNQELYSNQRYSHRLAEIIPNSTDAMRKWQSIVQHLCLPGNQGPPTAMTTVVSNAHASTIWAHVERGAGAAPNPEETLRYFTSEPTKRNINEHVALQTLDWRRRKRDFLGAAYSASQDAHLSIPSLFHVAVLCDKSSTSVCIHFDRVVLTCSYFDVSSGRGRSSSYL